MSKKEPENQKAKHAHLKGSKNGMAFKKLSGAEMAEFMARRAAGETEAQIAADLKRRKRA